MRTDEHIDALRHEGELLAAALDAGDLSAPIAHCPNWTVAELVRHIGVVHRRVAAVVRDARATPPVGEAERVRVIGPVPADDATLPDWYREGHARLVEALRAAPADLRCWTFVPSSEPRSFWARRQAHETAIHRMDAQEPLGARDDVPSALAADGVDELLVGILGATGGKRGDRVIKSDVPLALHVHATDTAQHWTVHVGPDGVSASQRQEPAACTVSAPAPVLYPLLWNRVDPEAATVDGDAGVLEFWRTSVVI